MHIIYSTKIKSIRFLLVFIMITGIIKVYSQQNYTIRYLRVSITDSTRNEPIAFANIVNKKNNLWIKTDSLGLAIIKAFQGDKLEISSIGFFSKTLLVTDSMLNSLTSAKIKLNEEVYSLKEIDISPFGSYQDFKYKVLHTKSNFDLPKRNFDNYYKHPKGPNFSPAPFSIQMPMMGGGGGGSIGFSFLIGSKFKQRMRFEDAVENGKRYALADLKYNRELVAGITHLEGAQLDSFFIKFRPPDQLAINASEYDMACYILNKLEVYKFQLDSLNNKKR
jgi:hypothetical protein